MKKNLFIKLFSLMTVLTLAACSNDIASQESTGKTQQTEQTSDGASTETVAITDANGTINVPVNPKNVVALDSRTFETLEDWGIELAAVPKGVMPADSDYVNDDAVQDIGNHREPNLELLAAADPEVVIVGQRFGDYYEEIKALVPNAVVIDLNFDVSEEAATPGENLINGLKNSTISLGKIFDKNAEAEALTAELDQKVADAKAAYNGTDTVMSVNVSAGNIGFAAPHYGRVWGPLYEVLDWTPALEVEKTSSDHEGDEISVEAIAQSNPDWIMVLDRDAAIGSGDESVPAKDVIEGSPALQETTAITSNQVVYAPADTYTNESIETFIELFDIIATAFTE